MVSDITGWTQKTALLNALEEKMLGCRLITAAKSDNIDKRESSLWLRYGKIPASTEAQLVRLQNRMVNVPGQRSRCGHCKKSNRSIDHLASRCGSVLLSEYTRRHDEVLRCVHLHLCSVYGLTSIKRIRHHKMQEIVLGNGVEIRTDRCVKTAVKLTANRPDIVVKDDKRQVILLIEVGITSIERLQEVETTKARKYDPLRKEMELLYPGYKAVVLPFVMTWDGLCTKYHAKRWESFGLRKQIRAYTQLRTLQITLEIVLKELGNKPIVEMSQSDPSDNDDPFCGNLEVSELTENSKKIKLERDQGAWSNGSVFEEEFGTKKQNIK